MSLRSTLLLLGSLFLFNACVDAPTAPSGRDAAPAETMAPMPDDQEDCNAGDELCEPWGGDPYDDGSCLSSTDGCTPTGGGAPTPPEEECIPEQDPDCEQPLTEWDKEIIRHALAKHIRPQSEFTDPRAAEECANLQSNFNHMMATGRVFTGATDMAPDDSMYHQGAYDGITGHIHFDPNLMKKARIGDEQGVRTLAETALHESGHALGATHSPPVVAGTYLLYAEVPFSRLNPGTNSCIRDA